MTDQSHFTRIFRRLTGKTQASGARGLEAVYRNSPAVFDPARVREVAEVRIGIPFLEGWVRTGLDDGRALDVRAIGSRSAHVIAGNVPYVAVSTMMRCALTRNDAIVKVPSAAWH